LRDTLTGGIDGAFFQAPPTPSAVTRLFPDGVERWFRLDDAPTELPAGIVFAPDYPRIPGDPEKILRASAFAGWIFAPTESSRSYDQIAALAARYARIK
jgi:hypothetical protein